MISSAISSSVRYAARGEHAHAGQGQIQVLRLGPQRDSLRLQVSAPELGDGTVPQQPAMVDHDHAVQTRSMSPVSCDVSSSVTRSRSDSVRSSSRITALAETSSPIVGSSRKSMRGE